MVRCVYEPATLQYTELTISSNTWCGRNESEFIKKVIKFLKPDIVVSIVSRLQVGGPNTGSVPGGSNIFIFSKTSRPAVEPISRQFNGHGGPTPGAKRPVRGTPSIA